MKFCKLEFWAILLFNDMINKSDAIVFVFQKDLRKDLEQIESQNFNTKCNINLATEIYNNVTNVT